MSIQITIKSKGLIKKKIDFNKMIEELKLDFGSYDSNSNLVLKEFYSQNQAIIFNPKKIGMGIFFDGCKISNGFIVIIIQDFTPKTEVEDAYKIITYICQKYKKYELYLNDEYITLGVLIELQSKILELSYNNLKLGCKRTVDNLSYLRLALFSLEITEEFREKFSYIEELAEFEEYINEKQKEKYYGNH